MNQTYITLNNGTKIPQFGMGVYMVPAGEETKRACLDALNMGYRHIDTAHAYQNERSVGFDIFDFELTEEEMQRIRALDKNARFFTVPLERQEIRFTSWAPED